MYIYHEIQIHINQITVIKASKPLGASPPFPILVPRGRAPFGQHQESRPLVRSNDILVLNGFVNTPEPIRFVSRFVRLDSEHAQSDGKSVNRGLPLLDTARGLHSGQTTGHSREHARDLRTSGHFPSSSHKISTVNLLHSSHLGTKFNHSAPANVLFPSFTA